MVAAYMLTLMFIGQQAVNAPRGDKKFNSTCAYVTIESRNHLFVSEKLRLVLMGTAFMGSYN